jgi:hypothetical protein
MQNTLKFINDKGLKLPDGLGESVRKEVDDVVYFVVK